MAALTIEDGEIVVRLGPLERVGALHGDVRVPISAVRSASVCRQPWMELRGMRAPGTGLPGVIMLGTTRGSFGKDFCAVYGRRPAVLVELDGQQFERLLIRTDDPDHDVTAIQSVQPRG
ncbi:MAG: hypothetical protein L0H79_03655 [Intrasporangium sp.]|uniref:hypothetical protein n=1 Tax=Intrasporangium sp. TaxID=1925024 RepID=UPI002648B9DD|nr:hypothetical protein [Intrasporangium sp.]MDN5794831.1 hypothetical protein [Intrasporangium sp.]